MLHRAVSLAWRRPFSTFSPPHGIFDVLVVGGGVVGAALAARLLSHPHLSALTVAVVESRAPAAAPLPQSLPDMRAYALSPASVALLSDAGAWSRVVESGRARNFTTMHVCEAMGPARLTWGSEGGAALGTMVEHGVLAAALWARLAELCGAPDARARLFVGAAAGPGAPPPLTLTALALPPEPRAAAPDAEARCSLAQATLSDGTQLRARLIVGADGAASSTRVLAGGGTWGCDYTDQVALVGTVRLLSGGRGGTSSTSEGATAYQRFLPEGPLAILPLFGDFANVVWSTSPARAAALRAATPTEFLAELNAALSEPPPSASAPSSPSLDVSPFGIIAHVASAAAVAVRSAARSPPPPSPPVAIEAVGPRASLPLRLAHADALVRPRVALVGDAAHSVHPLAGQGLNLGLADAVALVDAIVVGSAVGADAGAPRTLAAYARARAGANLRAGAAIDAIKRVFAGSPDAALGAVLGARAPSDAWDAGGVVSALRDLGMAAIDTTPLIKRALAAHAQGQA